MKYRIRNFWNSIKNIFKWIPILFRDKDWDYIYFLIIMEFKLKSIRNHIKNKSSHVGKDREVEYIDICLKLIDKIINSDYEMEYHQYNKTELNFIPTENNTFRLDYTILDEKYDDYFTKYPRIFRLVTKHINKDLLFNSYQKDKIALQISRLNHIRAKNLLFYIISKKMENWWT